MTEQAQAFRQAHASEPWISTGKGVVSRLNTGGSRSICVAPNVIRRKDESDASYARRLAERVSNMNRVALCVNACSGIRPAILSELLDVVDAIGAADEKPGHVRYLSKARMAELARDILAKIKSTSS